MRHDPVVPMMPHRVCYQFNPWLIWLHVLGDLGTALCYFMIAAVLFFAITGRRRPERIRTIFWFAALLLSCGFSHLLEIVTVWVPLYWWSGTQKAITAAISLTAALIVFRTMPALRTESSPQEFEDLVTRQGQAIERTESQLKQVSDLLTQMFARPPRDPESTQASDSTPEPPLSLS